MSHITPMLAGGLGNILFQLFSCYGIAKQNGLSLLMCCQIWKPSHHSSINYFENFLVKWCMFGNIYTISAIIHENKLQPIRIPSIPNQAFYIKGYLQNYRYFWDFRNELISTLTFNNTDTSKYPKLEESAFIHIRGGDYKNHPLHHINLTNYYQKAIDFVKAPHYYIFTNDEEYLSQQEWLKDVNYTLVRENEIDSLYLMSQCKRGAICANSTFSWWGSFLNIERPITMPSKWFHDPEMYIDGYFFPGVTVIEV